MTAYIESRLIGIVRHGEAVPHASTDAERPLTERGHSQARATARAWTDWLHQQGVSAHQVHVVHSPYLRARETADAFIHQMALTDRTELDYITPDDDPMVALRRLSSLLEQYPEKHLVVVSHMPLVASLSVLLEIGSYHGARGFQTAEMRVFQVSHCEPGCGTPITVLAADA